MTRKLRKAPARLTARIRGTFMGVAVIAWGLPLALLFNAVQAMSLLLLPLSFRLVHDLNCALTGTWIRLTVIWARRFLGARVVLSGDPLHAGENAIVLANHQEMADVTYLMHLALDADRVCHLKWFIKNSLKYVPGIGWALLFVNALFVKRNWAKDRPSIERVFRTLQREDVPLWLVLFAEGTRINQAKAEAAARLALKNGEPPLGYVLPPRAMGFAASVQGLKGKATVVYDLTLAYPNGIPSLWQYMCGYSGTAYVHVRRFAMSELPTEQEALGGFLRRLYREKDVLLRRFYETGRFEFRAEDASRKAS